MIITQSLESLRKVINQTSNHPHPKAGKGTVFCTAVGGLGRHEDDSCVFVSNGCYLDVTASITIGKWVMIGAYAKLYTHEHKIKGRTPLLLIEETTGEKEFTMVYPKTIGDDVWINESIILAKCDKIARGVVIAAGAVCTRPILDEYSIWGGNPAQKIGER